MSIHLKLFPEGLLRPERKKEKRRKGRKKEKEEGREGDNGMGGGEREGGRMQIT